MRSGGVSDRSGRGRRNCQVRAIRWEDAKAWAEAGNGGGMRDHRMHRCPAQKPHLGKHRRGPGSARDAKFDGLRREE